MNRGSVWTSSTATVSPRRHAVDDGVAEAGDRASTGKWRDAVGIGPADDELVAIDVCVIDAAGVEMFPDQADGDFLDLDRVLQRAQLLVERDQELPLDGHGLGGADSSRFRCTSAPSPVDGEVVNGALSQPCPPPPFRHVTGCSVDVRSFSLTSMKLPDSRVPAPGSPAQDSAPDEARLRVGGVTDLTLVTSRPFPGPPRPFRPNLARFSAGGPWRLAYPTLTS